MAKKTKKTYVGCWMKRGFDGYYGGRTVEGPSMYACAYGVARLFRLLGIPPSVQKFRVHATPNKGKGDWRVTPQGYAYWIADEDCCYPLCRSGLSQVPPGRYDVVIEYVEHEL